MWILLLLALSFNTISPKNVSLLEEFATSKVETVHSPQKTKKLFVSSKYLAAIHAINTRDYSSGANFLNDALNITPDDSFLKQRSIIPLIYAGKFEKAIKLLDETEEVSPSIKIILLIDSVKKGDYKKASVLLTEIGEDGIHVILYKYLEIWITVGLGDVEKALTLFDKLPQDIQELSFTEYHKGLLYEFTGDTEKSIKHYLKALELGGDRYRMFEALGCAYIRQGKMEDAEAIYRKYRDMYSNFIMPNTLHCNTAPITEARQGISESMMYAVLFFTYHRMTEYAYFYLKLSLHTYPELQFLKFTNADFLRHYGNCEDALKIYEQIPTTSPLYPRVQISVAGCYEATGQKDKAKEHLLEIANENHNYKFWALLGEIALRENKFEEAVDYYTNAIEFTEKLESKHWSLFFSRGSGYERLKNWEKAEADFLKTLELKPDEPLTLNYLAYSWIIQGKHIERSKEMLEKALSKQPNSPHIMDSYAWALFYLGDYENALIHMEKAVEIMPYNPTLNDHLGDIYWRLGRKREATFQWNRAIYYTEAGEETSDKRDIEEIKKKLSDGLPPLKISPQSTTKVAPKTKEEVK